MKRALLLILLWNFAGAYELSFAQFVTLVEKNSIDLIKNKAQFDADLQDQRANMSWGVSSVESEVSMGKSAGGGMGVDSSAMFVLSPRLPWVTSMLKQSLQTRTLQYQKNYDLLKNLTIIGAKRVYFSYLLTKEKFEIYKQKERNFFSQLNIAEAKFRSGSVSKRDYVNFKTSYYDAKAARVQTQKQLMDLEAVLAKMLGAGLKDSEVKVLDLQFGYLDIKQEKLKEMIAASPYVEILDLNAKAHGINAKASSYERWDSVSIGAGFQNSTADAISQNQGTIRLQVPIPLTGKYDHLKKKFLVLQSAALREGEVTKHNVEMQALSYHKQLQIKREYIDVHKESIDSKKALMEMGKVAYESQKISLFEYLAYQNAYMDALINMTEAKMEYIQTQTFLEETLGVVLGKGK